MAGGNQVVVGRVDPAVLRRPSRLAAVDRARLLLSASGLPLQRLTRIAATAARAPLAVVSLLDADTEDFVAAHGTQLGNAPSSLTLCQHVVSADAPVVIPDLVATTAAQDLPTAALDAGLVAYAGFPIHLDGTAVGTLCVADRRPRAWSPDDLSAVSDAALMVTNLLAGAAATYDAAVTAAETDVALDAMREAFLTLTDDGRITRWNAGAEATFGWTPAEALGRDVADLLVAPRSRPAFHDAWTRATRPGHPVHQHLPVWVRYRDGHEFPADASISVVDVGGRQRTCLFLHDASDRVAAARETARRRTFLESLLESLDAAVVACDAQGRLILFNRQGREMYGIAADVAPAEWPQHLQVTHADGRPMTSDELPLMRALAGEHVRDVPLTVRHADGRDRSYVTNGRQLRGDDRELLGAVIAVHDVTDLIRANRFKDCEIAVTRVLEQDPLIPEAAEQVLDAVIRALRWPYAELWLVDEEGDELRLAAARQAPGAAPVLRSPERPAPGNMFAAAALRHGDQLWVVDAGSEPTVADLAAAGVHTAMAVPVRSGGRALGVLTFFADDEEPPQDALSALRSGIAAHIARFLEQRRSKQLSVELARAKDEYIGLVGHEMRTPLTSISAYTDLVIEDAALNDDQRSLLAVVQRNAAVLRGIIAALLDLAALDSGNVEIRLHPTDLTDLTETVLDAARPALEAARLSLVTDLAPDVVVPGDVRRLQQVIDNLVDNAVRYSPLGGTVTVRLDLAHDAAVLSVSDTGYGIAAEERPKLFNRFFRGASAKSRGIPGSGLGLAICRAIVERHDGTLVLGEHEGAGTTFVLRLPLAAL